MFNFSFFGLLKSNWFINFVTLTVKLISNYIIWTLDPFGQFKGCESLSNLVCFVILRKLVLWRLITLWDYRKNCEKTVTAFEELLMVLIETLTIFQIFLNKASFVSLQSMFNDLSVSMFKWLQWKMYSLKVKVSQFVVFVRRVIYCAIHNYFTFTLILLPNNPSGKSD